MCCIQGAMSFSLTRKRQRMPRQLANIFSSRNSGAAGKRRVAQPGHGP